MLKFRIEQVALAPYKGSRAAALELLSDLGLAEWFHDHVVASGKVFSNDGKNEADLSFNYQAGTRGKAPVELEILTYTQGNNWLDEGFQLPCVSHLGMHCTAEELAEFHNYFEGRGIQVAQTVVTESHTNPSIAGKRRYNYVIYDTRDIIGVDLKFIVRLNQDGTPWTGEKAV